MSNDVPEQQPEEQMESHIAAVNSAADSGEPSSSSSAAVQPEDLSTGQSGEQSEEQTSGQAGVQPDFRSGDRVRVKAMPAYLKTADTMPMLRPPDLIRLGEEGTVIDRRPGKVWSVRFERGTFLMDGQYIERLSAAS